uniref:Uncharacterized protein n=1 Tax=Cacopsylla melanoneura TaxID=428564 RepID=A0A8D9B2R1_9HEMI
MTNLMRVKNVWKLLSITSTNTRVQFRNQRNHRSNVPLSITWRNSDITPFNKKPDKTSFNSMKFTLSVTQRNSDITSFNRMTFKLPNTHRNLDKASFNKTKFTLPINHRNVNRK